MYTACDTLNIRGLQGDDVTKMFRLLHQNCRCLGLGNDLWLGSGLKFFRTLNPKPVMVRVQVYNNSTESVMGFEDKLFTSPRVKKTRVTKAGLLLRNLNYVIHTISRKPDYLL